MNKSVNVTYIVLILEKTCSQKVSNYRPINLTTSSIRSLLKYLLSVLKTVLPNTIPLLKTNANVSVQRLLGDHQISVKYAQ